MNGTAKCACLAMAQCRCSTGICYMCYIIVHADTMVFKCTDVRIVSKLLEEIATSLQWHKGKFHPIMGHQEPRGEIEV
jgi:hypothetical protein